jgi:hypothetical protein
MSDTDIKITTADVIAGLNAIVAIGDPAGADVPWIPVELEDRLVEIRDAFAQGLFVKADDLMGVADLAAFFAVGATTVSGWYTHQARTGMPSPVAVISSKIPVWDATAVIDWWTSWVPRKGNKAGTLPWEREDVTVLAVGADGVVRDSRQSTIKVS